MLQSSTRCLCCSSINGIPRENFGSHLIKSLSMVKFVTEDTVLFIRLLYYRIYHNPITFCIKRVTAVIQIQQQTSIIKGFPPVFTSLMMSVLKTIAYITKVMKNFLQFLRNLKIFSILCMLLIWNYRILRYTKIILCCWRKSWRFRSFWCRI